MGYEFDIQFKEGAANLAADALSRKQGAELLPMLLDNSGQDLYQLLQKGWSTDSFIQQIISEIVVNPMSHPHYTWCRNELRMKEN